MSDPTNDSDATPDGDDRVHVAVLLDRSGSMGRIADDTIGGFNTFLAEQRELPGTCRITLVQFDGKDPQEVIADAIPVAELTNLTAATYQPRGTTPLLDACGMLLERIDRRVETDPEEAQLVAVITDGYENSSHDFTRGKVADLIAERRDAGWAFVFLGANIDSFHEARTLGMGIGQAANWHHSGSGIRGGFDALSASSATYRSATKTERATLKDELMDEARSQRTSKKRPRRSR